MRFRRRLKWARWWQHPAWAQGRRDMLSAALGIGAWGMMTGVALVQSGLGTGLSLWMTAIVYAGSSQLAAMPLLVAQAPAWVIWATAACVNLRFVVFSAHLRPYMMPWPRAYRLFAGYLCADLTYVMFVKRFPQPSRSRRQQWAQQAYLMGNSLTNWMSWMSCSVIGIALAHVIPLSWGLGFAGILALVGVTLSLLDRPLRFLSLLVGSVVAVWMLGVPLKLHILLAIVAAVGVGSVVTRTGPPAWRRWWQKAPQHG